MRHSRHNRGSAFILVVGMMVTLAMVGTVFFMIARADNQESLAVAKIAPMRSVAGLEVERICTILLQDLQIGGNGPYTSAWDPPNDPDLDAELTRYGLIPADYNVNEWEYRVYMDYASANPLDPFDRYLASTEVSPADGKNVAVGHWPQITNVPGYPVARMKNIDPSLPHAWLGEDWDNGVGLAAMIDTNADGDPDSIPLVDTDGDGVNDAVLYPTGSFDRNGEQFYAAVRVVDLSAFLNVNTAHEVWPPHLYGLQQTDLPISNMDLAYLPHRDPAAGPMLRLFPADDVHAMRSGRNRSSWVDHAYEAARRPENPDLTAAGGTYRMYDWSDELACRWRSLSPSMSESRLRFAIEDSAPNDWRWYSQYLTTASAGRIIPPQQVSDTLTQAGDEVRRAKVDLNLPLRDDVERNYAFQAYASAFYRMLNDDVISPNGNTNAREQKACQLAVNLIDYRDIDDVPTIVTSGDFTWATAVRGVERQPFISQAWCKIEQTNPYAGLTQQEIDALTPQEIDAVADADIAASKAAIVLYNPYDTAISLEGWVVRHVTFGEKVLDNTYSIPPGGRFAIRWTDVNTVGALIPPGQHIEVTEGLEVGEPVSLYRPGTDLGGGVLLTSRVPVARIKFEDEYNGGVPNGISFINMRRDDRPETFRIAIAAYHKLLAAPNPTVNVPDYTVAGSAIGAPNDLGLNAVSDNTVASTFSDEMAEPGFTFDMATIPSTPVFVRGFDDGSVAPAAPAARMVSVGELSRLLHVGPGMMTPVDMVLSDELVRYSKRGWLLSEKFARGSATWRTRFLQANAGVGRFNSMLFLDKETPDPTAIAESAEVKTVPDVPLSCLAADYFTVGSPLNDWDLDASTPDPLPVPVDNDGDGVANPTNTFTPEWNRERIVYGRININTAPIATLRALPMLDPDPANRLLMAANIVAYRDRLDTITWGGNFNFRDNYRAAAFPGQIRIDTATPPKLNDLRDDDETLRWAPGFASAGEPSLLIRRFLWDLTIPNQYAPDGPADRLARVDFPDRPAYRLRPGFDMNNTIDDSDDGYAPGPQGDLSKLELRYAYASNLLAVNSDTYCAYIWVQSGPDPAAATPRRYIAIIDRSNCVSSTDRPMIRAFAEVK